jgi:hypothetical protein
MLDTVSECRTRDVPALEIWNMDKRTADFPCPPISWQFETPSSRFS